MTILQTVTQIDILNDIMDDRVKQDEGWGVNRDNSESWILILAEEIEQVTRPVLEDRFPCGLNISLVEYRKKLIQIAAIAIAVIESFDRNEGREGKGEKK